MGDETRDMLASAEALVEKNKGKKGKATDDKSVSTRTLIGHSEALLEQNKKAKGAPIALILGIIIFFAAVGAGIYALFG